MLARAGFAGTLAFTLPEALWLAASRRRGPLVAYPTADRRALRALARSPPSDRATRVTVMVDSVEQLDLIDRALGDGASRRRRAARLHRPRRRLADARRPRARRRQALARAHARAGRRAGARDPRPRRLCARRGSCPTRRRSPASATRPPRAVPLRARAIRAMQALSARELARRRAAAVAAVQQAIAATRRAAAGVRQRRRHRQPRVDRRARPPSPR